MAKIVKRLTVYIDKDIYEITMKLRKRFGLTWEDIITAGIKFVWNVIREHIEREEGNGRREIHISDWTDVSALR